MSVIQRLRRNDPTRTEIIIELRHETSDADLARALEQNSFITEIFLELEEEEREEWNSLLRVIAARENLVGVTLSDDATFAAEERNAPAALVSVILRAIQQNTAVQSVDLLRLRLPTDVSTFVDTASSITSFSLLNCKIMAPSSVEREQGFRDLAAALQRNTNIERLELGFMDDVCLSSILQGLQYNTFLKTLVIGIPWNFSDATTLVIQQFLESTASIQTFGLGGTSFENNGDTLRTIAQSLIQSPVVCGLELVFCHFRNEESTALFRSILQNKRNLTSLRLNECLFSGGIVHETVISTLLRPNSLLRSFELQEASLSLGLTRMLNGQFQNLLRAVEKSKLERFVIGDIGSHEQLRALADSIPLMRLKELKVGFSSYFGDENIEHVLLQAVKNNFSLRSIRGERRGRDLFDDDDKARLEFYADRNERLDQWVDNPETVDRKVWPEALKLEDQAGPDSLFRGLRSVLESDYMSSRSGRKRKRPQFYLPS